MAVEFKEKPIGQHGSNIYFKTFTVTTKTEIKSYKLGLFYFVKKSTDYSISIAELQLIWRNTKEEKDFASVKLYFGSDQTEYCSENLGELGKDEVVEADRQVVIECSKFPNWECSPKLWPDNVGRKAYADIPKHILPAKDNNVSTEVYNVKILSFLQYCRYKTCLEILKMGMPTCSKTLLARGGIKLDYLNAIILFSRWQFTKENIEGFTLTIDVAVPVFKGRPRKRKTKCASSTSKEKSTNELSAKNGYIQSQLMSPYVVPVTRTATANDTSTIQMKLKKVSERKDLSTSSKPGSHSKNLHSSDPAIFDADLYQFMEERGTPIIKIPSVGCAKVNLFKLFSLVALYGGYGQVTLKRNWRTVYEGLGHSTTITNSATCTRKVYEKLLLPYEKHLRIKHQYKSEQVPHTISVDTPINVSSNSTVKASLNPPVKAVAPICPSNVDVITEACNAGNAFKLMIEKRRGRPSKEFREQIEKLKNMDQKVAVEIYPPLSKYSKLPAWLNDLNVDIVNPRQTPNTAASTEQTIVAASSVVNCNSSKTTSGNSKLKNVNVVDLTQEVSLPTNKSMKHTGYANHVHAVNQPKDSVVYSHNYRRCDELYGFEIKSVKSLAQSSNSPPKYLHFPYNSSAPAITVPHSVLSYNDYSDRHKCTQKTDVSLNIVASHYPVNHAFHEKTSAFSVVESNNGGKIHRPCMITCDRRKSPQKQMVEYRQMYSPPAEGNNYITHRENYGNKFIIHNPVRINHEHRENNHGYPIIYTHHPQYKPSHDDSGKHDVLDNNNSSETFRNNRHVIHPDLMPVTDVRESGNCDGHRSQRYESIRMLSDQEIVVVPSRNWTANVDS